MSVGWLFIASLVAFLAIYRTMLALHQHRLPRLGTAHADSLDSVTRMENLDRWGIFLTIAAIIYSVGFAIVLAEQVVKAVIDRIAPMFEFFRSGFQLCTLALA
jgi:hypothetical protein